MSFHPSITFDTMKQVLPALLSTARERGQYLCGGTDIMDDTTFPLPTKRCTKCGADKPLVDFSCDRQKRDGLCSHCKACHAVQSAAYYGKNKELSAAYGAAYYATNKEARAAYAAARYAKNREYILAQQAVYEAKNCERIRARKAVYRAENRERIAAYAAVYRAEHPEKMAAYDHNHRARNAGNGGTHTAADIRAQYDHQKGRCFYCKKKVGKKYHVDHVIPLAQGGSNGPENLVIACPTCNLKKNAKHPMDFAGVMF